MRTDGGADHVVRSADVGDPVADGLVDSIFQGTRAGLDSTNLRAQQTHAEDVERLPAHVLRAHVNDALQAELGAGGRGGDAVLSGAGLGDDALLAHALGQQNLTDGIVDLVRGRYALNLHA